MALNTVGLNEAYTRKQQGTANPTDLANLDYAIKNGWQIPTVAQKVGVNEMVNNPSTGINDAIAQYNASQTAPTFTDFTPQIQGIYDQIQKQMESINKAAQPTGEMASIGSEVANKQSQITNLDTGFAQGMNKIEDQAIPMPFITGQQASVQRQYNQQRGTLVAEESNLLNRLGLAQEAQKANLEAQKFGLSSLFDVAGLQMKAQDAINSQKQQVWQNAQALTKNAQDTLAGILEKFQGVDPDTLTAEATAQLTQLAQSAGIPPEIMFGGMRSVADQIAFDQSMKIQAANLAAYKAQPKGSASKSTNNVGANGTPISDKAQAVLNGTIRLEDLTPTDRGKIAGELNAAGYKSLPKLSTTQQEDIATMTTVKSLINQIEEYNSDGKLDGVGAFGQGTLKTWLAQAGIGSEEGNQVRALIGNIKGTIAKLRGGTSFTPNEEALLSSYVPTINDNPAVIMSKISLLKTYIDRKESDIRTTATERILSPSKAVSADDLINKYK